MNHRERLERAEAEASKYKVLVGPFVIGEIIKAYLGDDEVYVSTGIADEEVSAAVEFGVIVQLNTEEST